jgi:hypothetical protein
MGPPIPFFFFSCIFCLFPFFFCPLCLTFIMSFAHDFSPRRSLVDLMPVVAEAPPRLPASGSLAGLKRGAADAGFVDLSGASPLSCLSDEGEDEVDAVVLVASPPSAAASAVPSASAPPAPFSPRTYLSDWKKDLFDALLKVQPGTFWPPWGSPVCEKPGRLATHATKARIADTFFYGLLFNRMLSGEGGPARVYAGAHSEVVKPAFMAATAARAADAMVWVFSDEDFLWKATEFDAWVDNLARYLSTLGRNLLTCAKARLEDVADESKETKKPYNGAVAKVQAFLTSLDTERFRAAVGRLALRELKDVSFEDKLDSNRFIVSFANGVLNVATLELRPRTFEDFLTYALDYDWNEDADDSPMQQLISKLLEDAAAERALQTLLGYCFTGRTNKKMLLHLVCPKDGGKTTLLKTLQNAMGRYMSLNEIPLTEFTNSEFQDTLAKKLHSKPPVRFMGVDEAQPKSGLNEALMNNLADGKETDGAVSFAIKHAGGCPAPRVIHTKCFVASNHPFETAAASSGLVVRLKTVDFQFTFVDDWTADSPSHYRPRDYELVKLLEHPDSRAGIAKWLMAGASRALAGEPITCPKFERAAFRLLVRGDVYLAWLADKYFPTGDIRTDNPMRISLDVLVAEYKQDNRDARTNSKAYEGLKAVMAGLDYVTGLKYSECGAEVLGFLGIRPRKEGDPEWAVAREAASARAKNLRAAFPGL